MSDIENIVDLVNYNKKTDYSINEKRKHVNLSSQAAQSWMENNFTNYTENMHYVKDDIYSCYLETCTSSLTTVINESEFGKIFKKIFPDGYKIQPSSPYVDTIRIRKNKAVQDKVKKPKIIIDWPSIIKSAMEDLGNSRKGVRPNVIKTHVAAKHPNLNLDRFITILSREVYNKRFQLLRGIGAAGIYRLARTAEEEAEEISNEKAELEKKEKLRIAKLLDKNKNNNFEGDNNNYNNIKIENEKFDDIKHEDEEKSDITKATPKKNKKSKSHKKKNFPEEEHIKLENIFPIAITYNTEPKEASFLKILNYINENYNNDLSKNQLKKCLDSGCEKGYWIKNSGRSYILNILEFDPTADDDLTGMIINGIVACTEPKQCSVVLIKKYVIDYHSEYDVANKPKILLKALERAVIKNIIIQLSGIGANGTYKLKSQFIPSPYELQGVPKPESETSDDKEYLTTNVYKPRPTKRKGVDRIAAIRNTKLDADSSHYLISKKSKRNHTNSGRFLKKKLIYKDPNCYEDNNVDDDDDDDDEDEINYGDDDDDDYKLYKKKINTAVQSKRRGQYGNNNKCAESMISHKKGDTNMKRSTLATSSKSTHQSACKNVNHLEDIMKKHISTVKFEHSKDNSSLDRCRHTISKSVALRSSPLKRSRPNYADHSSDSEEELASQRVNEMSEGDDDTDVSPTKNKMSKGHKRPKSRDFLKVNTLKKSRLINYDDYGKVKESNQANESCNEEDGDDGVDSNHATTLILLPIKTKNRRHTSQSSRSNPIKSYIPNYTGPNDDKVDDNADDNATNPKIKKEAIRYKDKDKYGGGGDGMRIATASVVLERMVQDDHIISKAQRKVMNMAMKKKRRLT